MQKKLLEAALFMSPKPVAADELVKITGAESLGQVRQLVEELRADYAERGVVINETPFGYHMQVQYELLPRVAHLTPYADISEGCKRTLALAVYKEPITQSEIIKIQGNKAYNYVRQLEDMGLVKAERYRRTKLLKLTVEFERYFGMRREQVRSLIEQQLGTAPTPTLTAYLAPLPAQAAARLPAGIPDPTEGLKALFDSPKTVSSEDIAAISGSLKAAVKTEVRVPALSAIDGWEAQLAAAPADTQKRPAAEPKRPKKARRAAPKEATPPAPAEPALFQRARPPAGAALPERARPGQAPASQPGPKTGHASSPAPRPAGVPIKQTRQRARPAPARPAPQHAATTPPPAATQLVLSASGAVKPAVPVEPKKKKLPAPAKKKKGVVHKSAVKEKTRDEKNIFSKEGEIVL